MSERAQRVLDVLIENDATGGYGYPLKSLYYFFMGINDFKISEDYKALTVDEEKQIIEEFLEHSY